MQQCENNNNALSTPLKSLLHIDVFSHSVETFLESRIESSSRDTS